MTRVELIRKAIEQMNDRMAVVSGIGLGNLRDLLEGAEAIVDLDFTGLGMLVARGRHSGLDISEILPQIERLERIRHRLAAPIP